MSFSEVKSLKVITTKSTAYFWDEGALSLFILPQHIEAVIF